MDNLVCIKRRNEKTNQKQTKKMQFYLVPNQSLESNMYGTLIRIVIFEEMKSMPQKMYLTHKLPYMYLQYGLFNFSSSCTQLL